LIHQGVKLFRRCRLCW